MALTKRQAAAMTAEMLDDLAADLKATDDGEREIGDYEYPLSFTLRDMGLSDITEATTNAQERAVLEGMQYYAYLRVFRHYGARASSQQGAGASGMHLQIDWSSTAKTLRMHVKECRATYSGALASIGKSLIEDPDQPGTASQTVLVDRDTEVGEAILTGANALPWFQEAEY